MRIDHLDFVAKAASTLTESDGIRSGSSIVLEHVSRALGAQIGFTALRGREGDLAEIVSSRGLGAADFRRLEERIVKSSLWRILGMSSPLVIDDLAMEPVLSFMAYGAAVRKLTAVPIVLHNETVGLVAVGFAIGSTVAEEPVIKLLKAISALLAQTIRVERVVSEEGQKLIEEVTYLKQELREKYDFGHLIGNSSPMRQVYDQVTQVAKLNAPVLLRGERGTGKEWIANAIHYNSLRSKRPFIKVNCAALPESLVESELFGHEPGVFAGASQRKKGRFELADGGTLFLDEIGDLPNRTQAKVLRVIQEREFERLGGSETIRSNVRLITATNRDLEGDIVTGAFRDDLFYRLNVFTIFLPPLRERKSDILLLAEHFLSKYERQHKKAVKRISTPAIDMLTAYHFPGNVRELENAIERAVIVCDSNVIHGHHLPPTLQTAEVSGTETRMTLASAVEAFEGDLIQDTLKSTRGNIAKAAIMLDSTERILGYKIRKYRIDPKRFRR